MKTLTQYLIIKLTEYQKDIERCKQNLIDAANNLEITALIDKTTRLKKLSNQHCALTMDAAAFISVEDVVANITVMDKYTLGISYNSGSYQCGVSVEEARLLSTVGIKAKIKLN